MISETEVLENGDGKHRCQVVRWMRTFPFSFISKREYVIARRMWRGADGALYGITKVRTSCEGLAQECTRCRYTLAGITGSFVLATPPQQQRRLLRYELAAMLALLPSGRRLSTRGRR